MKKFSNDAAKGAGFYVVGTLLILSVTVLTIFGSKTLIDWLNADANLKYASAVGSIDPASLSNSGSRTTPGGQDGDGNGTGAAESLTGDTASDGDSSEESSSDTSDTGSSTGDDEDVTYPYYIGTEFVVIDPDGNMVYLIKRGDTLAEVSALLGYSVDELAEYNHIQNVHLIYAQSSLRIPADPDNVETVKRYVAQRGGVKLEEDKEDKTNVSSSEASTEETKDATEGASNESPSDEGSSKSE